GTQRRVRHQWIVICPVRRADQQHGLPRSPRRGFNPASLARPGGLRSGGRRHALYPQRSPASGHGAGEVWHWNPGDKLGAFSGDGREIISADGPRTVSVTSGDVQHEPADGGARSRGAGGTNPGSNLGGTKSASAAHV